ncbi:MAG: bifunctional allantoicase/(S)-ureidoglycine aminohydrolase [Hyphomicrobiaceae bacterium]
MTERSYYFPTGGLPPQTQLLTDRAVFTESYAVIPKGCLSDIVTSYLPGWNETRAWVLARPLTGFAETFSQMILEIGPGGGAMAPEPDRAAQGVYFVVSGELILTHAGTSHTLKAGAFAYLPAAADYEIANKGAANATVHWFRKEYEPVPGLGSPDVIIAHDSEIAPTPMPDTDGRWATTRFVDPTDLRHDMHVTIVTLEAGAVIPFLETHVMEHGLYVLEGKGAYKLNRDWVEVEAGDFMWLRAFCPQACYAGGPGPFRYLLYKDVNRFPKLSLARRSSGGSSP